MKSIQKFLALGAIGSLLLPAMAFAEYGSSSVDVSTSTSTETSTAPSTSTEVTTQATVNASVTAAVTSETQKKAHRFKGKTDLVSISETTLVVKDRTGKEWTFPVTADTRLRTRHGKATLADFHAGDKILVAANKKRDGTWVLRQALNMSVGRATINGEVNNVNGLSFDITSHKYGAVHVTATEATKWFLGREEKPATSADLKEGMRVTAKGKLHMPTKTLIEVRAVILHVEEAEAEPAPSTESQPSGGTQ